MTPADFDKILERYVDGRCTEAEKRQVEAWFHAMGANQAGDGLDDIARQQVKAKLWSGVNRQTGGSTGKRFWALAGGVAAAVVVLVVSVFLISRNNRNNTPVLVKNGLLEVENTSSVIQQVALADGSIISLEPGSTLRYPEHFGQQREVYLTGEAFFKVFRDEQHPFLVYADDVVTRVLGTSFRVKAYGKGKEIRVAVTSGKVSVFKKGNNEQEAVAQASSVILTPNQEVVFDQKEAAPVKKLVEVPQVVEQVPSLKMEYANASVVEVFKALEKSYGVDIQFDKDNLQNCTITTDLAEEGLYERIEILCHVLDARYRVEGTTIIITANGCR